jgi:hypothetical protein
MTGMNTSADFELRVFSRAEVAELLGRKTPRYVDLLVSRGLLKRFVPRGNKNSIGITATSLRQFLAEGQ